MAAPPGWSDPLERLGPIAEHPTLTPADSPLSSAPASPGQYRDLQEKCSRILRDYEPEAPNDDTVATLEAFLQYLSKEGQMTLMGEIEGFDHDQLRQLRQFLVHAILNPSTSSICFSVHSVILGYYLQLGISEGSWRPSSSDPSFALRLGGGRYRSNESRNHPVVKRRAAYAQGAMPGQRWQQMRPHPLGRRRETPARPRPTNGPDAVCTYPPICT